MLYGADNQPISTAKRTSAQDRSVKDLVLDITAAERRMSKKNPHKEVLRQCAVALVDLSTRLQRAEQEVMRFRAMTGASV